MMWTSVALDCSMAAAMSRSKASPVSLMSASSSGRVRRRRRVPLCGGRHPDLELRVTVREADTGPGYADEAGRPRRHPIPPWRGLGARRAIGVLRENAPGRWLR